MSRQRRSSESAIRTVTSTDGTSIAYERHGEGPPLVLLHGGSVTRHSWMPLVSELEEFSMVVPDRRGRGDSGDGDDYSLNREVADLRAVLDALDDDATVFGHSFGGLIALAATEECTLDRLVVYEPALLTGDREPPLADRIQERLEAGKREATMELFYSEGAGVPDPQQLPVWPERIRFDLLETVIRETRATREHGFPGTPAADTLTLLLTGEHGPEYLCSGVRTLDARTQESEVVTLDGVGHLGVQSAPGQVAAAIRTFCQRDTR